MDVRASQRLILTIVTALAFPAPARAQLKVIMSGGFANAYNQVLPEFERTTGIRVTTGSGASQGQGPETIGGQLRRGVPADVVIMTRDGLSELIAEGRIVAGSDVDLAQTLIGVGVRSGAPKPDISTVATFRQTLLDAKSVAMPGSTTGIYMRTVVLPQLGIAGKTNLTMTARGAESAALVAAGNAELAVQPVSELVHVAGVDLAGPIPMEIQHVLVFAAAVVTGSKEHAAARRLIEFLAGNASSAIRDSGMQPPTKR